MILVAGVGNLFLSDDGFGPEVVRAIGASGAALPPGVEVVDYGIRGMHLAYDLLKGYNALVLVDAVPRGGASGELTLLKVGPDDLGAGELDAHGMNPVAVLASLDGLGGELPPTYVVGCRPADLDEGIGLSKVVEAAVPVAVRTVLDLVARLAPERADVTAGRS